MRLRSAGLSAWATGTLVFTSFMWAGSARDLLVADLLGIAAILAVSLLILVPCLYAPLVRWISSFGRRGRRWLAPGAVAVTAPLPVAALLLLFRDGDSGSLGAEVTSPDTLVWLVTYAVAGLMFGGLYGAREPGPTGREALSVM